MNVKILVCCHKKDIMAKNYPYFPIHVGKSLSNEELDIQPDNVGINISCKNRSYCELTGMYWAWKNLKGVDIIGLCHYRRYFDFHHHCKKGFVKKVYPTTDFYKVDLSVPQDIINQVALGKIVVAKPRVCSCSLYADYACDHVSDDMRLLRYIVNKTESDVVKKAFFKVVIQGCTISHYNMFLMRWSDFDAYCTWLFNLLAKVEIYTDIESYNTFQKRIYGYMSERLLLVWLVANGKVTIKKPIIWFNDSMNDEIPESLVRFKMREYCYKIANLLYRPRTYYEEDMNNPAPRYVHKTK